MNGNEFSGDSKFSVKYIYIVLQGFIYNRKLTNSLKVSDKKLSVSMIKASLEGLSPIECKFE